MKDIEKLIKWFIPIYVIHFFVEYSLGYMLSNSLGAHVKPNKLVDAIIEYSGLGLGDLVGWLTTIIPIFERLDNAVIAVWLYFLARKNGDRRMLWAAFGIISGLFSVVIYYVIKIYYKQKAEVSITSHSSGPRDAAA